MNAVQSLPLLKIIQYQGNKQCVNCTVGAVTVKPRVSVRSVAERINDGAGASHKEVG